MKIIKDMMYKASLTFTLTVIAITAVLLSASSSTLSVQFASSELNRESLFGDFFRILMFCLGFSCCIGLSFIVFEIKKMPPIGRRIVHICVCYAISLAFFLPQAADQSKSFLIFALITVVMIVVYPTFMLISFIAGKLEQKLTFKE